MLPAGPNSNKTTAGPGMTAPRRGATVPPDIEMGDSVDMTGPTTRIGSATSDTSQFRMRGKDVLSEILGEMSFTEAFYFIVTGRELTREQGRIFDACVIVLMDHGITPQALVSRLVHDAVPTDLQVPVASGLLMVGNKFAGTMAGCGKILQDCMAQDGDRRAWLAETVAEHRARRRFIPGFGHPYYKPPPRGEAVRDRRGQRRRGRVHRAGQDAGRGGRQGGRAAPDPQRHRRAGRGAERDRLPGRGDARLLGGRPRRRSVAHVLEEQSNPIVPDVVNYVNAIPYVED